MRDGQPAGITRARSTSRRKPSHLDGVRAAHLQPPHHTADISSNSTPTGSAAPPAALDATPGIHTLDATPGIDPPAVANNDAAGSIGATTRAAVVASSTTNSEPAAPACAAGTGDATPGMAGDAIPGIHVTLYSERIMPVVVVRDAATAQATADGTPASAVAPPAPPGATPGMLHDATPGIQAADEMEVDDTDTTPTITAATSWPALPATAQHRQHAALPDAPGVHNASNHVLVPPGIGMEPPRPPATTYAGSVGRSTGTTTAPPQRVPPRAATHPPTAPNGAVPLGSGARPAAAATALPPPDQVVQVHSPMMLDDVIAWLQSTAARGDIGNEVTFQYALSPNTVRMLLELAKQAKAPTTHDSTIYGTSKDVAQHVSRTPPGSHILCHRVRRCHLCYARHRRHELPALHGSSTVSVRRLRAAATITPDRVVLCVFLFNTPHTQGVVWDRSPPAPPRRSTARARLVLNTRRHYVCVSRALYGTGPHRPRPAVAPRALVWY